MRTSFGSHIDVILPTPGQVGQNRLLAGLAAPAFSLLQQYLRLRDLAEGAVLWEAGSTGDQVYFPCSGMISIRVPTSSGHSIEIATVGRESAVGFLRGGGQPPTITRAVTELPGQFACISAERFAQLAHEHRELATVERCCGDWLLLQMQQIAACTIVHSADARVSRWLLRACDAAGSESIHATQDGIADTLGLRRTTVTLIAQRLQQTGAIRYSRGKIMVCSRAGLEASACDCHRVLGQRNWPSANGSEMPPSA
jgi:CRP-like cAMP-binding protein